MKYLRSYINYVNYRGSMYISIGILYTFRNLIQFTFCWWGLYNFCTKNLFYLNVRIVFVLLEKIVFCTLSDIFSIQILEILT